MSDVIAGSELLDEQAAGRYLGLAPGTLSQWRSRGKGPTFVRLGRFVRYTRSDLDAFLASLRVTPGAAG